MTEPLHIIQNGKNIPFGYKSGFVPQMDSALQDQYQPMTFIKVAKGNSGGMVVESGSANQTWKTPDGSIIAGELVNFMGTAPTPKIKMLFMKDIGQRSWAGVDFFSQPQLKLKNDDCVIYKNVQYRVMHVGDYSLYQFMQYFMIEDYVFSGPLVPGLPT